MDDDANGYIDDLHGWDFRDGDNNPLTFDCTNVIPPCPDPGPEEGTFYHGTAVAGVIGAIHDNSIGPAGCAPKCVLMSLKVLSDDPLEYGIYLVHVLQALEYAAENGAKVINCSFTSSVAFSSLREMCKAVGDYGAIVVCAAGNEGVEINTSSNIRSPAIYGGTGIDSLSNVVSVAGTFANDQLCVSGTSPTSCNYSSNYSSTFVTIAAPGYQLWTTVRTFDGGSSPYKLFWGTSSATPVVSATAALVFSEYPTWTPAQVKARLIDKVRSVSGLSSTVLSGGVVDAGGAVSP